MKASKSFRDQVELWLMLVFLTSLGWSFGLILTSVLVGTVTTLLDSTIKLVLAGILGGIHAACGAASERRSASTAGSSASAPGAGSSVHLRCRTAIGAAE